MSDETTFKPVVVQYAEDVAPTPEHPTGFTKGSVFEVATPEQAWAYHPDAVILQYADGSPYSHNKAKRDVRERDNPQTAPVERSKAPTGDEGKQKASEDSAK